MNKRASGLLLHITSLDGKYGIGDLGPQAYHFADFLSRAKQSYWQILPLNPPHSYTNISPYNCLSAFAGNTSLISPELLYKEGYLKKEDIKISDNFPQGVFLRIISKKLKKKDMKNFISIIKTGSMIMCCL